MYEVCGLKVYMDRGYGGYSLGKVQNYRGHHYTIQVTLFSKQSVSCNVKTTSNVLSTVHHIGILAEFVDHIF